MVEQQRDRRRGRYKVSKIYGDDEQEGLAIILADDWRKRAIESSPLRDPVAKEALAEALAAAVVTLRLLREAHAANQLTGEEVGKIPSLAGKVKQLCEALHISDEIIEEDEVEL